MANEQGVTYDVGGDGSEMETSLTLGDDSLDIVGPITTSLPAPTPAFLDAEDLLNRNLTLISLKKTERVEEDGKMNDKQNLFHAYARFSKLPFKK